MGLIRALIADDHAAVRRQLRRLLQADPRCCVCGEASDGEEAVRLAAELRPDVVVLDHSMPGLGGLDAARRIRASRPETRAIIVSMHEVAGFAPLAAAVGIEAWIPKGEAPRRLLAAVLSTSSHKDD